MTPNVSYPNDIPDKLGKLDWSKWIGDCIEYDPESKSGVMQMLQTLASMTLNIKLIEENFPFLLDIQPFPRALATWLMWCTSNDVYYAWSYLWVCSAGLKNRTKNTLHAGAASLLEVYGLQERVTASADQLFQSNNLEKVAVFLSALDRKVVVEIDYHLKQVTSCGDLPQDAIDPPFVQLLALLSTISLQNESEHQEIIQTLKLLIPKQSTGTNGLERRPSRLRGAQPPVAQDTRTDGGHTTTTDDESVGKVETGHDVTQQAKADDEQPRLCSREDSLEIREVPSPN
ncbi:hypothetical protein AX16_007644 [Volvariella volvacea WC 439]|nr:hypothetical protein AX16_007644 [Volvariella volvacea WC 439]